MKTLILGASTNQSRYSNMAALSLLRRGFKIELLGKDKGEVSGIPIKQDIAEIHDIDTVTLYLNPSHQASYQDFILNLKPRRVIFNPGTENPEFQEKLAKNNIEPIEACTLVMLSTGEY